MNDIDLRMEKISLEISEDDTDVAYLRLPGHPGAGSVGAVKKTIRLHDLLAYSGPDIYLELDESGHLIGAEILA